MAFGRSTALHDSWYQEQVNMINSVSEAELDSLSDGFDQKFMDVAQTMSNNYNGLNIMRDAKKMMDHPEVMLEYKQEFLGPILEEYREIARNCGDETERVHLESVADQLDAAWDESARSFMIQESFNVANYLPLSTLDFPALIKQYIKFLGKDVVPVQTASSVNIEQRIFTKYLVNNQTGEEYEVPKIYWQKEADGTPTWRKLWNAGKGIRINDKDPILLSDINSAANKRFDMFTHLLDDNGNTMTLDRSQNLRARLSYDFNIQFVNIGGGETVTTYVEEDFAIGADKPTGFPTDYYTDAEGTTAAVDGDWDNTVAQTYYKKTTSTSTGKKVKLPGAGISIDIQTGGVFLNGGITENMKLPVVDPTTNLPTGETVSFSDRLSGVVDFVKGYVTASACGTITGIYVSGHLSNETNLRTIGFREYPEIRKYQISDGCRFQLPFTVEDFAEANASLNFNLYNRLVQELVVNQEMFEDEYILEFLDEDFEKYDGYDSDVWSLESYTHTEYVDLDPTSISPSFAGDPWEYRTNAINNALASLIYELCDRGKLENLGFVVYGNPKVTRLLNKFVTWTVKKSTDIGGVQMNHSFGVMTDFDLPVRVVASNRVDAYTIVDDATYINGATAGDKAREYFLKIVAYPMDKFHISYKHLRFARHLTNSPENAAYADAANPGGAAMLVTTSSQYKMISIQGIQGRIIFKNSHLVPDSRAGIVKTTNADATTDPTTGG